MVLQSRDQIEKEVNLFVDNIPDKGGMVNNTDIEYPIEAHKLVK